MHKRVSEREENGTLYPIEIKKDSNPNAIMTEAFMTLDNIGDKTRGCGCILCCCPIKMKLRDNLYALPTAKPFSKSRTLP